MLELFPVVGPVLAGTIAVTVGLFQPNVFGWEPAVYGLVIAGMYTLLRYTEDYLVIPNVIGRVVHLHPLVVLFALLAGATLGGVLGMFIAVPTCAMLKVILSYIHCKLLE
jgi:predicted PurR-regulated permease PerM